MKGDAVVRALWVLLLGMGLLAGCQSGGGGGAEDTPADVTVGSTTCVPGKVERCPCLNGQMGVQPCNS